MKPLSIQCADFLEEMKYLLELNGENPFKTRAFEKAADVIRGLDDSIDLKKLADEKKLTELPGIGKGISETLTSYILENGKKDLLEELKKKLPAGLVEFSQISGLGPKKAKLLIEQLNITTYAELEYACRENRLLLLKGFGEKLQKKVFDGVIFLQQSQGKLKLLEAQSLAEAIKESFLKSSVSEIWFKKIKEINLVGECVRGLEVVEALSFLIVLQDDLEETIKVEIQKRFESEIKNQNSSILIQIIFSDEKRAPFECFKRNASPSHFEKLLKISEKKEFKCVPEAFENLKQLYSRLGYEEIPPECREDNGEFEIFKTEAFLERKPIELAEIQGAFHFHSTESDGALTLEEVVLEAIQMGWKYIGISDHSQSAFYAKGLNSDAILKQKSEILKLQKKYPNIKIFFGIESDILKDGSLDYEDSILKEFDFVIASIHSRFDLNKEEMTERLIKAIENPFTTMIGHLTGRILLGRKAYDFDMDKVLQKAAENKVIIELNAHPSRLDLDWRLGERARSLNLMTSINPDAHDRIGFKDIEIGVKMARKALFSKNNILNSKSPKEVEQWMESRKNDIKGAQ